MWPIDLEGFEPIRQLGSGGFGKVWLAEQTDLDRQVAVKIGHNPLLTLDGQRRFDRERRALGRLSGHRHIVGIHTAGISNDLPYIVMAYIDNGTLTDRGQEFSESELRLLTDQLADAIGAAHEIGIIHRDLKPENVFIDRDGSAVLGDFGTARLADWSTTASRQIVASMAFVAPEILEGEQPTIRTDIYGIGITIIAAILGRSPFVNDDPSTPAGLAMQVMKGNAMAVPPGRISPEFEALLLQCMHLDPQQRPSGASMLRHQLAKLPPPIENTVDSDAQNATTVIEMVPQDDAAKKHQTIPPSWKRYQLKVPLTKRPLQYKLRRRPKLRLESLQPPRNNEVACRCWSVSQLF